MRVRTRLLVFGVLAPALAMALALVAATWLFNKQLLASVDRELIARAAVESGGAFDGPTQSPHLHLGRASFPDGFVELDPRGALYDQSGALVASDPANLYDKLPRAFPIPMASQQKMLEQDAPVLWTSNESYDGTKESRRELSYRVRSPQGEVFFLRLSCSLGPLQQTLRAYLTTTIFFLAAILVILISIWAWLARTIGRRLESIARRLPSADVVLGWNVEAQHPKDEIRELDEALGVAFDRLARAQNLQEDFLSRAAHELKTPLGIMQTEIDLALRKPRSEQELKDALVGTRQEIFRLSQLSHQLLELTSLSHEASYANQEDASTCNLPRSMIEVLEAHESLAQTHQVRFSKVFPERALAAIHPEIFLLIINNLIRNAIRHSPSNEEISLSIWSEQNEWILEIQNGGEPIAEGDRETVFLPFVRGKNRTGQGTGLGLTIAKTAAKRAGGRLELQPSEHKTIFRLTLLKAEEAPYPSQHSVSPNGRPSNS